MAQLVDGRMRALAAPPARPTVYFMNTRAKHWTALGVDLSRRQYASIGARRLGTNFADWAAASNLNLASLMDVSPVVGSQTESECGARVAIFAEWFLNERAEDVRTRRPIPNFAERVDNLMAAWRAARNAARNE